MQLALKARAPVLGFLSNLPQFASIATNAPQLPAVLKSFVFLLFVVSISQENRNRNPRVQFKTILRFCDFGSVFVLCENKKRVESGPKNSKRSKKRFYLLHSWTVSAPDFRFQAKGSAPLKCGSKTFHSAIVVQILLVF